MISIIFFDLLETILIVFLISIEFFLPFSEFIFIHSISHFSTLSIISNGLPEPRISGYLEQAIYQSPLFLHQVIFNLSQFVSFGTILNKIDDLLKSEKPPLVFVHQSVFFDIS